MTEAEREKIKLRANYLNGVALLFLGLGGLGPLFAVLASGDWKSVLIALVWLWAGGMSSWEIHQQAQRQLNKLTVDPVSIA